MHFYWRTSQKDLSIKDLCNVVDWSRNSCMLQIAAHWNASCSLIWNLEWLLGYGWEWGHIIESLKEKTGKSLVTSSTIVGWETCKKKGRKRKKSSHMLTFATLQNLLWLHQSIPVIQQSYFLTGCEATSARKR